MESPVRLRYRSGRRTYLARIQNITREGILVLSDTAFPPGTTLRFEIPPSAEHRHRPSLRGMLLVHRAEGSSPPFEIAGTIVEREESSKP